VISVEVIVLSPPVGDFAAAEGTRDKHSSTSAASTVSALMRILCTIQVSLGVNGDEFV
jgi:hypothetical protein